MAIVYNQHFNRSVVIPWLDVLTLDEMSITPSLELHLGSGRLFGDTTLPGHKGQATHALVFMLAGAMTRWKQVVAYHYSGNYTDGAVPAHNTHHLGSSGVNRASCGKHH